MDKDGWLKFITQFSNVCGASLVNNQIILFNGHSSQFDDSEMIYVDQQNIQPFVLKSGDSVNGQPYDNGPNAKLNFSLK